MAKKHEFQRQLTDIGMQGTQYSKQGVVDKFESDSTAKLITGMTGLGLEAARTFNEGYYEGEVTKYIENFYKQDQKPLSDQTTQILEQDKSFMDMAETQEEINANESEMLDWQGVESHTDMPATVSQKMFEEYASETRKLALARDQGVLSTAAFNTGVEAITRRAIDRVPGWYSDIIKAKNRVLGYYQPKYDAMEAHEKAQMKIYYKEQQEMRDLGLVEDYPDPVARAAEYQRIKRSKRENEGLKRVLESKKNQDELDNFVGGREKERIRRQWKEGAPARLQDYKNMASRFQQLFTGENGQVNYEVMKAKGAEMKAAMWAQVVSSDPYLSASQRLGDKIFDEEKKVFEAFFDNIISTKDPVKANNNSKALRGLFDHEVWKNAPPEAKAAMSLTGITGMKLDEIMAENGEMRREILSFIQSGLTQKTAASAELGSKGFSTDRFKGYVKGGLDEKGNLPEQTLNILAHKMLGYDDVNTDWTAARSAAVFDILSDPAIAKAFESAPDKYKEKLKLISTHFLTGYKEDYYEAIEDHFDPSRDIVEVNPDGSVMFYGDNAKELNAFATHYNRVYSTYKNAHNISKPQEHSAKNLKRALAARSRHYNASPAYQERIDQMLAGEQPAPIDAYRPVLSGQSSGRRRKYERDESGKLVEVSP